MPVSRRLPSLPHSDIPLIDPRTGRMDVSWYRFFVELMATLAEMRSLIP